MSSRWISSLNGSSFETVAGREYFGARAPVVFGWVFASHQIGSAVAAWGGGVVHDLTGSYDPAWYAAGGLCLVASALSISVRLRPRAAVALTPEPAPA